VNILSEILNASGGDTMRQLGRQFGLDQRDTERAVASLLPAVSGGLKRNMAREGGLSELLSALGQGNHERYLDDPAALTEPDTRDDGNSILGHLLGSKKASRDAASTAAQETGLDLGILKQMLPIIAAMAMGSMNKGARSRNLQAAPPQDQLGGLASLLDLDGDGSVADDLIGLAGKFLR
jgi:hypothetical protein